MSEWGFAGELDVGRLLYELEQRGAKTPELDVDLDADGRPTKLRISYGVAPRLRLNAAGNGHAILRDSVRVTFEHRSVEAGRLARRRPNRSAH